MFHGLGDQYLLHGALNGTWEWLEQDLTLVTIPGEQCQDSLFRDAYRG